MEYEILEKVKMLAKEKNPTKAEVKKIVDEVIEYWDMIQECMKILSMIMLKGIAKEIKEKTKEEKEKTQATA